MKTNKQMLAEQLLQVPRTKRTKHKAIIWTTWQNELIRLIRITISQTDENTIFMLHTIIIISMLCGSKLWLEYIKLLFFHLVGFFLFFLNEFARLGWTIRGSKVSEYVKKTRKIRIGIGEVLTKDRQLTVCAKHVVSLSSKLRQVRMVEYFAIFPISYQIFRNRFSLIFNVFWLRLTLLNRH